MFVITAFLIILVFLQTTILPVKLLLPSILALCFLGLERKTLIVIFSCGLLLDILNLRLVGTTSMFYLITGFVLSLYQKKMKKTNYLYIIVAGLLVLMVYSLVFFRQFNPVWLGVETAIILVFYLLFYRLIAPKKPLYD